jgi:predicted DNA repair protein MutK
VAGSSLLALLDDVATILDDVAILAKVAAKKTTGVLGDDLALNAQQVAGVSADRELPVVWAVAKGSALNKLILVPLALLISRFAPWLVTPLLMVGGTFLCFEGFEKVAHRFLSSPGEDAANHADRVLAIADPAVDLVAYEKGKIRGAVRTDFVLSAEIVAISLGIVASAAFPTQVIVLCGIAALMTVGVYGFVAVIVKLDDMGLYLNRKQGTHGLARCQRVLGSAILASASRLMKALAIAGTVAMFLVGGGILEHGIPALHHVRVLLTEAAGRVPGVGGVLTSITPIASQALLGVLTGAATFAVVAWLQRLLPARKPGAQKNG